MIKNAFCSRYWLIFSLFLFVVLVSVASFIFQNKSYQHSLPYYLSSSLNNNIFDVRFVKEEIERFNALNSSTSGAYNKDKGGYSFSKISEKGSNSESVKDHFGYMISHGFLSYIKLAKLSFGSLGDMNAVIAMNIFVHIVSTLFFASLLRHRFLQVAFCLLYGLNPLILHLATFPYYYYPVVGFSAGMVSLYNIFKEGERNNNHKVIFWILVTMFFVTMRPTLLIGFTLGFLYFLYKFERKFIHVVAIASMILLSGYIKSHSPSEYSPWFSIYVGLGAHHTIQGVSLSDESAHDVLRKAKLEKSENEALDTDLLRERVIDIVSENKLSYLGNSLKNILQGFGYGYHTSIQALNYLSMTLGALTIVLLFKFKFKFLLLLIFAENIGYSLYFPPIPAYMAPTYILITYGWMLVLLEIYRGKSR